MWADGRLFAIKRTDELFGSVLGTVSGLLAGYGSGFEGLAHAGGPTLQVGWHRRSVLTVLPGLPVQSVRMQSVCICHRMSAGRWYGWVLRDHGADTRVY